MKVAKSGRIAAIAIVMALGIAGSFYTGYWSRMERYVTSIVSPASVEVPAWVKSAQGLEGAKGAGSAAGTGAAIDPAGAAYHGGAVTGSGGAGSSQAIHGGPQATGFNSSLLPNIVGYATVLGLFAALVRLVDLFRKRRISARCVDARLAAGAAAVPAAGAARAPSGGAAGAAARRAP